MGLLERTLTLKIRLAEGLWIELGADRNVCVDCRLTHNLGKKAFADKHSVLGRTKQGIHDVSEHLNAEKAVRLWINDDVCLVESACDCERIVVANILAPDDMHKVVADVTLLLDLLRILWNSRHGDYLMEDDLCP